MSLFDVIDEMASVFNAREDIEKNERRTAEIKCLIMRYTDGYWTEKRTRISEFEKSFKTNMTMYNEYLLDKAKLELEIDEIKYVTYSTILKNISLYDKLMGEMKKELAKKEEYLKHFKGAIREVIEKQQVKI